MSNLLIARPVTLLLPTNNVIESGDTYIRPQRSGHPTLLFGIGNTSAKLYKMAEGDKQWSRPTGAGKDQVLSYTWSFANGVLLGYTASGGKQLFRSTDNGETWSAAVIATGLTCAFSTDGAPIEWSFIDAGAGTALLVEYGAASANKGRYGFLTRDYGVTWTLVLDSTLNATPWMHIHGGCYHRATERFVLGFGDGVVARIATLLRDGSGYSEISPPVCRTQPISWIDFGSAIELVAGDDGMGRVICVNVLTGAVRPVLHSWNADATNPAYCWALAAHAGLIYACVYNNSSTAPVRCESTILAAASVDGPWIKVATLPATVKGAQTYAGYRNGLMHWQMVLAAGGYAHVAHAALTTVQQPGTAVGPERTNIAIANADAGHDANRWAANHATLGTSATGGVDGGACVSAVCDGLNLAISIYNGFSGTCPATPGVYYTVAVWVKPDKARVLSMQARISEAGYTNATLVPCSASWFCPADVWTRVESKAFRMPDAGAYIGCYLELTTDNNPSGTGQQATILIDQFLITQAPGPASFVAVGALNKFPESSPAVTLPARSAWTELLWFQPDVSYWQLIHHNDACVGPYYIRSWKVGAVTMALRWVAGAEGTLSGSQTTTITAAAPGIFRPEMVGEVIVARKADRTGGVSVTGGKISSYTSATVVVADTDFSSRLTGERVFVEAPRFELFLDNGAGTTELLYTLRNPLLRDCPTGLAIQVGGPDAKVRAWATGPRGLEAFTRDGSTVGSLNDWTAFLNAAVAASYSRPAGVSGRELVGLPGKQCVIGSFGYLAADELPLGWATRTQLGPRLLSGNQLGPWPVSEKAIGPYALK